VRTLMRNWEFAWFVSGHGGPAERRGAAFGCAVFLRVMPCVAMEPDYAVTLTPVVAAAEVDPVPLELVAKLGRNCCRSDCSEA